VWEWMNRMISDNDVESDITKCGILTVFSNLPTGMNDTPYRHETLGVYVYVSEIRSKALELCGWVDMIGIKNKITRDVKKREEWEEKQLKSKNKLEDNVNSVCEDSFERAAALALWQGDIALAVSTLRSFSSHLQSKVTRSSHGDESGESIKDVATSSIASDQSEEERDCSDDILRDSSGWDEVITEQYLNAVILVTACFAGYFQDPNRKNDLWISMCQQVVQLLQGFPRIASQYLIGACKFLLASLDISPDYWWILNNNSIYLDDRISFACNFVSFDKMDAWLKSVLKDRKANGTLDGLLLTGLSLDSFPILQKFLDITCDIQTCALITCHLASSRVDKTSVPPSTISQWLYEYRNLLNIWQMFFHRSLIDVEIGKIQRKRDEKLTASQSDNDITVIDKPFERSKMSGFSQSTSPRPVKMNGNTESKGSKKMRQYFPPPLHNNHSSSLILCQVSFCVS